MGDADRGAALERVAFGSCAKESREQPIWSVINGYGPDLWVWAGDNVYADTEDMAEMARKWGRLGAIPGYAELAGDTPVMGTWDDHDYGENDAGAAYPKRAESQQLFLDFLGVPADSPRRGREGVYHAETFGPAGRRVQVIVLDTRYHRSPLERYAPRPDGRRSGYRPLNDRSATLLGEAQWAWLGEQLREPADVRLIVSSIQFVAEEHRFEKWANLPRERSRMMNLLDETGATGVVFLSGDRHHAELSRVMLDNGQPIYDLTASGINQSRPRSGPWRAPEQNQHRVGRVYRGHHFGTVDIDWDAPDPLITLSIVDDAGERVIERDVKLGELRPGGHVVRFDEVAAASRDEDAAALLVDGRFSSDEVSGGGGGGYVADDGRRLTVRFTTPEPRTARRYARNAVVGLDLDGSGATGLQGVGVSGVDLAVELSPPRDESRGRGPWVTAYDADGRAVAIDPEALGVAAAPTYGSRWFELSFDRTAPGWDDEPLASVSKGGTEARAVMFDRDRRGDRTTPLAWGVGELKPADDAAPAVLPIPDKPAGALRVVAYNVLWARPLADPGPFSRLLRAIDADVLLLQEWERDRYAEHEIVAWFAEHVDADADADWQAMVTGSGGRGSGTAVVSRFPIAAKLHPHTPVEGGGWDFPARIAGATVDSPVGRFLFGNVHFKAGGYLGSDEDDRRAAEAVAVNFLLHGMKQATSPDVVVFGGDYNLNGATRVVETAVRGLDVDGSPLAVAAATHLHDPALLYTHGRDGVRRRLDYIAYSDSSADLLHAFVVDTTRLDDATLGAHGLERGDSHASDHLPVVIDLRPLATTPTSADRR